MQIQSNNLTFKNSLLLYDQTNDEVLARLSVWSKVQTTCKWSSWCHCHPIICGFIKIQTGLTFLVPAYPGCPGKEARCLSFMTTQQFHGLPRSQVPVRYKWICLNESMGCLCFTETSSYSYVIFARISMTRHSHSWAHLSRTIFPSISVTKTIGQNMTATYLLEPSTTL